MMVEEIGRLKISEGNWRYRKRIEEFGKGERKLQDNRGNREGVEAIVRRRRETVRGLRKSQEGC